MLRQRRKHSSGARPRKSSSGKGAKKGSTGSAGLLSGLFELLGIRKLRPNPPVTPEQQRDLQVDALLAALLFVVALATRFYRLAIPAKIVFDEWHFAAFVDNYMSGRYLFDIHPPLGKLTLAAAAKLGGYGHINYTFEELGQDYGDLAYYPQRAFAALVGSAIPPVMYCTCRALELSPVTSVTTAAMPLFDMLLCVESRLILTDSQLVFYIQAALLCALKLWNTPKSTPKRYFWLFMTAFMGACAISTKWTAFVAPVMIGIISLTGAVFPREGMLDLLEMVAAGVIAIVFYVTTFWVHFKLLPYSGPGDAFMTREFQQTLIGNKHHGMYDHAIVKPPNFIQAFRYLNWEMLRANSAIEQRHHWESKWYEWLYNARGILYIDQRAKDGKREQIYLISNPVLTLVSGVGVVASVLMLLWTPFAIRRVRRKMDTNDLSTEDTVRQLKKRAGMIGFFLVGWGLNLLPYIGVKRCTFLYHVLPALQMACLLTAIALEQLPTKRNFRHVFCLAIIGAMAGAFYYWRAWTYALHRTYAEIDKLRLMPRWN